MMLYVLSLCFGTSLALFTTPQLDDEWQLFQIRYGKNYTHNEHMLRRLVWESNVRLIRQHNVANDRGESSYRMGINQFTDMSFAEVQKLMMGYKPTEKGEHGSSFLPPSNVVLPNEVDWRSKGLVTPVKNQGQCGSCWAFSAVGSLEGQHAKSTGKLESMSPQNLVDCSSRYGNLGCDGGRVEDAFDYVKDNNGIDTESAYPYTGTDDPCTFKKSGVGARISGYQKIKEGSEDALKSAVATTGPISVCIDATSKLQHYSSGIFDDHVCSSTRTNHCVLVVGYGTKGGEDYWLVKNSWGTSWGMDGYVLMSRNKNDQCGIASDATFPLMRD